LKFARRFYIKQKEELYKLLEEKSIGKQEKKYFNNDMVIWADAGGLREDINSYKNNKWPNISNQ
jgi:hypothetical protein